MDRDEQISVQKELLASTFSQARAYTNLILAAGYAGFFATWTFTRELLSPAEVLWSALLVTMSIAGFITWEVFSMIHRSRAMLAVAQAVADRDLYAERIVQVRREQQEKAIIFGRIWVPSLIFIVGTAAVGALILMAAFVRGLFRVYAGA